MTIRVLKSELEAAKHDQASALQRSMTQENTFNSTMSTAIDEIRAEHEDTLHHREDQIKVRIIMISNKHLKVNFSPVMSKRSAI